MAEDTVSSGSHWPSYLAAKFDVLAQLESFIAELISDSLIDLSTFAMEITACSGVCELISAWQHEKWRYIRGSFVRQIFLTL